VAAISIISAGDLTRQARWDSEAFTPEVLRLEGVLAGAPRLDDLATVTHPAEIPRVYTTESSGVPFLLAANLRAVLPDFAQLARIPAAVANTLANNELSTEDVLVTRTGANYGVACVYLGESGAVYTSGEGLIVRIREGVDIDGAYLGTFLGCQYGSSLCKKAGYGSGQPHVAPGYLRSTPILRLEERIENKVGQLVRQAWTSASNAYPLYAEAESELLDFFGWYDIAAIPRDLFFVENATSLAAAGRWDADFLSPRSMALRELLCKNGKTIGDVADLACRSFTPTPDVDFNYIEIGDVGEVGDLGNSVVRGADAASRAEWLVEPGDVLTTTVRPIRRLSGIVSEDQGGYVCSNGFAVLTPRGIEPEVLLAYLRLPPVCELMDLYTTASMYPAISVPDLLRIPFTAPSKRIRERVVELVKGALLEKARARKKVKEATTLVESRISALVSC
jgi:type I restriction enzyme M protein